VDEDKKEEEQEIEEEELEEVKESCNINTKKMYIFM